MSSVCSGVVRDDHPVPGEESQPYTICWMSHRDRVDAGGFVQQRIWLAHHARDLEPAALAPEEKPWPCGA
jgi:hypothetical protein